jgi:hypothetical protein
VSGLQQALAVVGGLVALATLGGGLWAIFRTSAQDSRIKFLESQTADYLSRLNYIEPKLKEAEQQNRILLELHNPAEQIKQLAAQEQTNHDQTITLLTEQKQTLALIESRMPRNSG